MVHSASALLLPPLYSANDVQSLRKTIVLIPVSNIVLDSDVRKCDEVRASAPKGSSHPAAFFGQGMPFHHLANGGSVKGRRLCYSPGILDFDNNNASQERLVRSKQAIDNVNNRVSGGTSILTTRVSPCPPVPAIRFDIRRRSSCLHPEVTTSSPSKSHQSFPLLSLTSGLSKELEIE